MLTGWIVFSGGLITVVISLYQMHRANRDLRGASTSYLEYQAETKKRTWTFIFMIGLIAIFFGSIPLLS